MGPLTSSGSEEEVEACAWPGPAAAIVVAFPLSPAALDDAAPFVNDDRLPLPAAMALDRSLENRERAG